LALDNENHYVISGKLFATGKLKGAPLIKEERLK